MGRGGAKLHSQTREMETGFTLGNGVNKRKERKGGLKEEKEYRMKNITELWREVVRGERERDLEVDE